MPVGQFPQPSPNKLIAAMQKLNNKAPIGINRLYVSRPIVYVGTYIGAEVLDANLAIVKLQGGATVNFLPKMAGLTLVAGDVVRLEKTSSQPLTVMGKIIGNFTLASSGSGNVTPPSSPSSFHTTSVGTTTVALAWTGGTDHFGSGLYYNILLNGKFRQATVVGATTATITGLQPGTAYTAQGVSVDGAGNASGASNTASWTTSGTPPVPSGTLVTKTYAATALRNYNLNGHGELDGVKYAYQGDDQVGGWNRVGLIFFDYTTIHSDMAGSDPQSCKFEVTYAHWYYTKGGTAVIGTHDYASIPSVQSGTHGTTHPNIIHTHSDTGKRFTVDLGVSSAVNFKTGAARGIHIGPGLSQDPIYYGYTYGLGSLVPKLTLSWITP